MMVADSLFDFAGKIPLARNGPAHLGVRKAENLLLQFRESVLLGVVDLLDDG